MGNKRTQWRTLDVVLRGRTPPRRCFPSLSQIRMRAWGARSVGRRAAFEFQGLSLRQTTAGWTHHDRPLAAVLAERALGRPLRATEAVRHRDGNVWDCSEGNLEVVPR